MKDVVSQISGMATENSTMFGSVSQWIWSGLDRMPAR